MQSDYVIETHRLTKYYGRRCVVDSVDLAVPKGSVFGFLGRNGAGKSTTIRMLLGLVTPTRGTATVLGHPCADLPPEVRGRIGYMAEGHHVHEWMSIKEAGDFQSASFAHWNNEVYHGVLDYFGLKDSAKVKDLSRGERAGLCLGLTLAPEPELLILDDPALGLDPVARRSLLQSMIYVTRAADRTILFSSHILADVERIVDHVAVLDHSVLRAQCSLDTFRDRIRQYVLTFPGTPPETPKIPGLLHGFRSETEMIVTLANPSPETDLILARLHPETIQQTPLGLEDAFIDYMGERRERSFFMGAGSGPEATA